MNMFTHIMMFGWIPLVVFLFLKFPPRRAVIISFIFAWLFLPVVSYPLPGLPDYTKMSATCWGVFIGAAIFDTNRLLSFRLRLIDLPMILWCICPVASSLDNGLGLYDGIAAYLGKNHGTRNQGRFTRRPPETADRLISNLWNSCGSQNSWLCFGHENYKPDYRRLILHASGRLHDCRKRA